MFKQWVARVGQVFADEVLGLVIGSEKSKAGLDRKPDRWGQ